MRARRRPWPWRSMLTLVIAGFAIVAAPLLVAVVVGSLHLDRLTLRSERLVRDAVELARAETALTDGLLQLERNARQYRIVGREELREVFLQRREQLRETLDTLGYGAQSPEVGQEIATLRNSLDAITRTISEAAPADPGLEDALERFAPMRDRAGRIVAATDRAIARELETLGETSRRIRRFLFWQSAALIPVTVVLGGLFSWLILRPIGHLARAIRSLGAVETPAPIAVGGPPEIRDLGRELERLRARLERSEAEKNRFLRHMSHELKTPLAAIREGTELMADGSVTADTAAQQEILDILRASSVELQQLIENLLVVSARDLSQEPEAMQLDALADEVLKRHRLAIARADLRLQREVEGDRFTGFRPLVHSALSNLIGNAIRFSPAGGTLYLHLRGGGGHLVIEVADEGPGIPAEERPHVFEPFYQGTAPRRPALRGTGVGLSVVRDCARAHDGSVEIVDGRYKGAHIRLTLRAQHRARGGAST